MSKIIYETSVLLLILGGFIGFIVGIVGTLISGGAFDNALWNGSIGCLFGGFLVRGFLSVCLSNIRSAVQERSEEKEKQAENKNADEISLGTKENPA